MTFKDCDLQFSTVAGWIVQDQPVSTAWNVCHVISTAVLLHEVVHVASTAFAALLWRTLTPYLASNAAQLSPPMPTKNHALYHREIDSMGVDKGAEAHINFADLTQ